MLPNDLEFKQIKASVSLLAMTLLPWVLSRTFWDVPPWAALNILDSRDTVWGCPMQPLSGYAILISTYTITLLSTLNYILLETYFKIHFPNMIRKQVSIALVDGFKHYCYSSQASAHKPSPLPLRSDAQIQFPASLTSRRTSEALNWHLPVEYVGETMCVNIPPRGSYSTKSSWIPLQ